MRIRVPIACAFCFLLLISVYLGFGKVGTGKVNDKFLHFVTFFLLTLCFYWVIDTSRRRIVHMTLVVMFLLGSIGSEFVQGMLPYRKFDAYDIVANLFGSGLALSLNIWYHRRMMERRRHAKNASYHAVPDEEAELGIIEEENEEEGLDGDIGVASTSKATADTIDDEGGPSTK